MTAENTTKKVKVLNKGKEAARDARKKTANDGVSKARQTIEDGRQTMKERRDRQAELAKSLEAETEKAKKEAMKAELDRLEEELRNQDVEMKDAEQEEARFQREAEEAEKEDVHDLRDVEEAEKEDVHDSEELKDRDKPRKGIETSTTTQFDPNELADALLKGLRLSPPAEAIDLTSGVQLRDTQAILCYKNGFGKPAIVVDCEVPEWPIYRIRKDVLVVASCPNLMKWRRAGRNKDPKSENKWTVDDIKHVHAIAIEVPPGYSGNPEEQVRLIPPLSIDEKKKLKDNGKPVPKQPDMQLLIEWKEGFKAEGEDEPRFTSWESRSGCRTLWKKHKVADDYLLRFAMQREGNYRKAGGRHSSEERLMSAVPIPRAGSTESPGSTPDSTRASTLVGTPEDTPEPEIKKEPVQPGATTKDAAANKKAARAEFKAEWCDDNDIDPEKMTDAQDGSFRASFKAYWDVVSKA